MLIEGKFDVPAELVLRCGRILFTRSTLRSRGEPARVLRKLREICGVNMHLHNIVAGGTFVLMKFTYFKG